MLEGNYNFRCDELPTVMSNEEVRLSISFIDAIQFTIVNPKSNTSVSNKPQREKKKRSRNPSAFFPYRPKQEWKTFKMFIIDLQIGCNLYSFKRKSIKKWLESRKDEKIKKNLIFALFRKVTQYSSYNSNFYMVL